jgi:hypothetical protein
LNHSVVFFNFYNERHGDLFYIAFGEAQVQPQASKPSSIVIQDAVDDFLDKQDGLIKRNKDPKLYVVISPVIRADVDRKHVN